MKNYSFDEVTLLINGVEITGASEDDDAIIVRRLEDSMGHVVGNRGEMAVFTRASRAGEIVIKLMQTDDDNQFLSGLVAAAENGAFVPVQAMMKDNLGGDLVAGTKGYIRKPADMTRGTPAQMQEWVVVVERLSMNHAGGQTV